MLGTLYIVATPIGNLEDITLRALRILKKADLILAEDTRVTRKLLMHYDIDTHILSYHAHSGESKKLSIFKQLIEGKNIALVTDAGTPGVSDPGNELVDFILGYEPGIKMVPVPGASAISTALSVCGFNINKFVFLGFLPKKKRKKLFEWLKEGKVSFAFYESPKRILKSVQVLADEFGGQKRIFIGRELTKLHETLYRGTIVEVKEKLLQGKVKGEMVVIVEN